MSLGLTENQFRRAVRVTHRKSIPEYLGRFYAEGRYLIRQKQFELAEKGNVSMLKWLGIQDLGQRHHVDLLVKTPLGTEATGNDSKNDKDAIPAGYRVLTPGGTEIMIDAMGKVIGAETQERETPKVEQMLLEEAHVENVRSGRETGQSQEEIIINASEIVG